jgi:hypothetical protein
VWNDKLCVIRQLNALLKWTQEDLIDEFDRLLQRPWRDEGLSPNDIKIFCQEHQLPYYCLGTMLLDSWIPAEPRGKGVAFSTWNGHCYMYKSSRIVSQWKSHGASKALLKGEARSEVPPFGDWKPYTTPEPGFFFTVGI